MTDDLVKRLRSPANVFYEYAADDGAFLREAADRIEQLEAALRLYAGFESNGIKWEPIDDKGGVARAALGEKKDD